MNVILNHMDTHTSLMYRKVIIIGATLTCISQIPASSYSSYPLKVQGDNSKDIIESISYRLWKSPSGASESITQLLLPYDKWTDNEVLNWQRAPLNQATLEKRRHQLWCAATSTSSTASLPASELCVGLIVLFLGALERLLSRKHPSNVTGTSGLQFPPHWAHLKSVSVKSVN